MASRNITLNLPEDLIRSAKVYAAEHDTSVNGLIKELLEEKLISVSQAREAGERLLELAERGPWFDFDPRSIKREELHERK